MSKTPEQISNLCYENDKLRELWRIRDAIVDAALKWDLPELKHLCAVHRSVTFEPAFIIPPLSSAAQHFDCGCRGQRGFVCPHEQAGL